jgi:UDP-N-acetyl-D-glucosamine dehydrogenase
MAAPTVSTFQDLVARIRSRQARVGIIGLGYVGLPLAVEFSRQGFDVTGFDVDRSKVDQINAGSSYIPDVASQDLCVEVRAGRLRATSMMSELAAMDVVDIAVPTPLRKTRDPDLSYVAKAVESVAASLRVGQLVVLESTTYPGTTDEVVQPMLEESGLQVESDFFLAFSPERVDPGNAQFTTRTIPKVVGGVGAKSTEAAALLYGSIVSNVVQVSSTRVAEMVKLLENTFRAVNIGLVNEIALMCHPFYLSWKARQSGFECRFIELAGHVNGAMPDYVVGRIGEALNSVGKPINGSRVHVFGVAYKKDVNDVRESPALDILELLRKRGARLSYTDPHVPTLRIADLEMTSIAFASAVATPYDCWVIVTDHSAFDYRRIAELPVVVDTRNALKGASRSVFKL